MPKSIAILFLACIFKQNAGAQLLNDSIVYGSPALIINKYYTDVLGEHSLLYNGVQYIEYAYTIKEGHPFFETRRLMPADIHFDGMIFRNVPTYYDLVKDVVVIEDFQKVFLIVLPANKVRQFTLSNHTFIRIEQNDSNFIKTGFYDQLYNGKIGVFVKRKKALAEKKEFPRIEIFVEETNIYYILKDGIYHSFKTKNGLLKIFNDKRKGIMNYFKKNGIRFKPDPEKAIIAAAGYYNRTGN